jgi:very-short-patch-repair endonuclease
MGVGGARLACSRRGAALCERPRRAEVARAAALLRGAWFPAPRVNADVAGKEVDFLFEGHALLVETDSWRFHKTRRAFENDRARDAIHARAGYRTLRFTGHQLTTDPHAVAETVASALRA